MGNKRIESLNGAIITNYLCCSRNVKQRNSTDLYINIHTVLFSICAGLQTPQSSPTYTANLSYDTDMRYDISLFLYRMLILQKRLPKCRRQNLQGPSFVPSSPVSIFHNLSLRCRPMLLQITNLVSFLQVIQSEIKQLFCWHLVCLQRCQWAFLLSPSFSSGSCLCNPALYKQSGFFLLCEDRKKRRFLLGVKREISQYVQVLRMRNGKGRGGIGMNTRFMSLWDFPVILKGHREPYSFLVQNDD